MTSVIIAGVEQEQENFDYTMQELASLVQAAGMEVTRRFKQKLVRPLAATYLGKGKAEEIRNLENITGLRVLDRTALILEIFATRAKTREAKLQVKIAQLQYRLPRLHTGMSNKLDQQTSGGGYTNRGAGETKL